MSLFTQKMRMLTAVVLDGQSDAVVKALLEEGVMDFVHISELDKEQAGRLNAHKTSMNKSLVADLRGRCENLMKQGRIPLPSITKNDLAKMEAFGGQAARSLLDSLSDSLSSRREEQRSISQKLLSFQEKYPAQMNMAVKKDGGDIDALTAATISSRAYADAVARAYEAFKVASGAQESTDGVSGATATHEGHDAQEGGDNE